MAAPPTPLLAIPPPVSATALSDAQVGLTEVLKRLAPDDTALHRAIERLRRLRYVHPPREFTGIEACFQSHSLGDTEHHRVGLDTDGTAPTIACTCPGRGHPWCVHRLRYRLELAELALRDPVDLLERIISDAARFHVTTMPNDTPPPPDADEWWLSGEPPPHTDADRRESPPLTTCRRTSPDATADVQTWLDALDDAYPL
ncbi:MAG: hypothetical protein EI684_21475 [Candidatus Viridilinea halotolerans]|uniref:SWIM-type domain-containing protein n=1 Tax=Candidatus Viridilinea halotolerans TaxID=2491704 RepID=A0A426TRG9_9CHLR|nr:MAG: hypothetical protein EI684_21475 [Candidatus Viridilinea halotolerans]